ncbi:MAG: glycine cleavage system protein T [Alphaproteobacteria bacterium]|nr:MAG: glycine cleavage system protein T [Alphaproteobacteria bacterium]
MKTYRHRAPERQFTISPTTRLRPSPFFEATIEEGVTGFYPYNNMLMPTGYGDPEGEYWRLINGVSMWDVAVERQIELRGRDAARLAQILAPRRLDRCKVGQGKYVALCDHRGVIINDPIVLKLADDRFWLSIADNNICLWARGIAAERGLEVEVFEAPVSPMAVQGPKAEEVIAHIFGDWVRDLRYFWFREARVEDIPVMVARSGWSKQGGFEIYLMDESRAWDLWHIVREAGRPWDIGPGNPNMCERIESGLLSYGGDTDDQTNPFEVRLERFVDLDVPDDVIGIEALRRIHAEGPRRHQLGVILDDTPHPVHWRWQPIERDGRRIGDMTNGVWSWRLERNIGFALVERSAQPGDEVTVIREGEPVAGRLVELPFL